MLVSEEAGTVLDTTVQLAKMTNIATLSSTKHFSVIGQNEINPV